MTVLGKMSPEPDLHGDALAQAVVNLSRLFTTARATLPLHYLDDPAHASAYLSYFLPVNLSKVQVLLDELPEDSGMRASDHPTAVLDLGCGPGTGALALLDWLWHRGPGQRYYPRTIAGGEQAVGGILPGGRNIQRRSPVCRG